LSRAPDSRAEKVAAGAGQLGLDAILIGDLVKPGDSERVGMADVAWVAGFTGTSGLALVGPEVRTFITDFRYSEQAREQVPGSFEIVEATAKMIPTVAGMLSGRVGIDETKTSVDVHRKLSEDAADGVELIAAEGLLEGLRRVKDEREIAAIAEAARVTDEAYAFIEERGLAGRTEREVALAAEVRMRELGAEDPSFAAIVAAGPNGARPHAVPGERRIGEGEYVVVDMGAIVDGYCSDCTRTLVDGEPEPGHREVYELVLRAQEIALDAVRPGAHGREVDAIARAIIEEGGHGERFGHGLGHGVGIEVHEAPTLSKRSEDELRAGDVVTVEPGIYVPGEFGVRIEDLVVVTDDGPRVLTGRPK
jgi:Xaa-Pro aminopeptidase